MNTRYAWTITADHIADTKKRPPCNSNAVGMVGPAGADITCNEIQDAIGSVQFRMRNDDGNLYYEGVLCGVWEGFEPLDDFGTANAGCTSIELFMDGKWQVL